jgi:hypothetical protein
MNALALRCHSFIAVFALANVERAIQFLGEIIHVLQVYDSSHTQAKMAPLELIQFSPG